MVTVEDVKAYLGIDYADDMVNANITRAINTADAYLKGSIGNNYPTEDPRVKELALIIVDDLYNNRGSQSTNITGNCKRLVDDMSLQLRLELRRGSHEQGL